ncbi:MAG: hypothetical protein HKO02_04505 [Hyphomonadaceae bacterium]|nr:hypothetical protein [Hyphomonadaceae bacterium]
MNMDPGAAAQTIVLNDLPAISEVFVLLINKSHLACFLRFEPTKPVLPIKAFVIGARRSLREKNKNIQTFAYRA